MPYVFILLVTLAASFAAQSLALRAVGGRTVKSESNYFSSLGRIQAGAGGSPGVMLLGSSITGRLPDRAQGFGDFANMGCDGGSAVDALRAMDRNLLPMAPVLVIEGNTLLRALDPKPSEVGLAMEKPWFQAGLRVPAISAYARPSAFFYSILLARKIGGFGPSGEGDGLKVDSRPRVLTVPPAGEVPAAERFLIDELVPLVKRLRERGCRPVFVWLPPGREQGSAPPPWLAALMFETGSEWWDLGTETDPALVELTDGVHMAAPSAAKAVISLHKGLRP